MKRFLPLSFFLALSVSLSAQSLMTFDSLLNQVDTFWDGSDLKGYYAEAMGFGSEDSFRAINNWDTNFGGYWAGGYAVSTMTDDTTAGFSNLFGSITGGGFESDGYGVVSAFGMTELNADFQSGFPLSVSSGLFSSAYITNSTYAYLSMQNGDGFAKAFGGSTGDDPDYFFIRFSFYSDSSNVKVLEDEIDFYLADFRFADNAQDYILDDWVKADFTEILNSGPSFITQVRTQLFSSDTNANGILTPSFYCIDNIQYDVLWGVSEVDKKTTIDVRTMYDAFNIANATGEYRLYNLQGQLVEKRITVEGEVMFKTDHLPKGIYVIEQLNGAEKESIKILRW